MCCCVSVVFACALVRAPALAFACVALGGYARACVLCSRWLSVVCFGACDAPASVSFYSLRVDMKDLGSASCACWHVVYHHNNWTVSYA